MFVSQIAVSILDVCSAVASHFGYASAVWGDSRSSKIKTVWQSSHSGAAPFCVVQDLLWGILYQNRQMDCRYSAVLALPFFPFSWDTTVQKSSVGTMTRQECMCFHVKFLMLENLRYGRVPQNGNRKMHYQKLPLLIRINFQSERVFGSMYDKHSVRQLTTWLNSTVLPALNEEELYRKSYVTKCNLRLTMKVQQDKILIPGFPNFGALYFLL